MQELTYQLFPPPSQNTIFTTTQVEFYITKTIPETVKYIRGLTVAISEMPYEQPITELDCIAKGGKSR